MCCLGLPKKLTFVYPERHKGLVLRNDVRSDVSRENIHFNLNVQALTRLLRTEEKLIFSTVSQFEGFVTFVFLKPIRVIIFIFYRVKKYFWATKFGPRTVVEALYFNPLSIRSFSAFHIRQKRQKFPAYLFKLKQECVELIPLKLFRRNLFLDIKQRN